MIDRSLRRDPAMPCSIPSLERGVSASVIETLLRTKRYRPAAFSILAGYGVGTARCHPGKQSDVRSVSSREKRHELAAASRKA